MDAVWGEGDREVTARNVADLFPEHAYTTVATVLDRLVHKGLVRRRKDGRTVRFAAVGTGGAHTAVLMHQALASGSDADAALVRFAETLSPAEAEVLLRALEARTGTLADRGAPT
jgi:predicted transcriptional regulator